MTRRAGKAPPGGQAGTTNRREERRAIAARRHAEHPATRGVKWSNREYVPMRLAPFQETTATIQGLYPFVAEAGIDAPGILVGRNLLSSGSFAYDTFELYRRGMLFNPNGLVQGTVGSGKSSLVKTTIKREAAFGIKSVVPCDPKGEYTRLARWMGYQPVFLGPGLRTRLNPLDVPPRPCGLTDADWVREISNARISLLAALASATLGRAVTPAERKAITIALQKLTGITAGADADRLATPILPDLVAGMLELDDRDAQTAGFADARAFQDASRDAYLVLDRLVHGDLAGMFDGPSTTHIDFDDDLVVLNLERLQVSDEALALALIMACSQAWMEQALMRQDGIRRKIWYDECWRMMRVGNGHLAARLSAQQKLARQWGIGVWLIFHKLKDLSGTSPAMREIAEGMLSETGTRVSYHQAADQLEFTQQMLALTDTEASEIGGLDVGESLWQVEIRGTMRSFLVEHVYSGEEWPLLQTNSKMLGQADTSNTDTPSVDDAEEWGEVA
jgi:type IV secretory pathway VirB4 component